MDRGQPHAASAQVCRRSAQAGRRQARRTAFVEEIHESVHQSPTATQEEIQRKESKGAVQSEQPAVPSVQLTRLTPPNSLHVNVRATARMLW